jgi:23S rRNA pseudouridine2605 synthase
MIRLQTYIAHAGICSRRKAEHHILDGRVAVNGMVVTRLGTQIDPAADRVEVDGRPVMLDADPLVYIMINKPAGYITSCRHGSRKIVMDLIDIEKRIFPVGRLDKDSTGLLLLTSDGDLHLRLTHPSFDHEKEYEVSVADPISDPALAQLRNGIVIDGTRTRKAGVRRLTDRSFRIILKEGRKRQIRRMVESVGNRVTGLHRIRVANLRLGDLAPGKWRYLTKSEISDLTAKPSTGI